MSGEEFGKGVAGDGILGLEVRAWFCEWAREARKGRELQAEALREVRALRRDVHGLVTAAGVKRAKAVKARAEEGWPAASFDSEGHLVPACRICGRNHETLHENDGENYDQTNCFVEGDLCRECRELGDTDVHRRAETAARAARAAKDLSGQTTLAWGGGAS